MTIEIYTDSTDPTPMETHEWVGTLGAFIAESWPEYDALDEQPIAAVVDGVEIPANEWAALDVTNSRAELRVVQRFEPITWAYIAIAALAAVSILTRPNLPRQNATPQGRSLQSTDAKANVAKPNQTVPELIGRHLRYPDYLVPPRRYFADQRTQYLETLVCIGPGRYAIEGGAVKVANTALSGLPGAEFHIYAPGENVAAHGMHQNWYGSPEVGGTSAGTAGLELSSEPIANVQPPNAPLNFSDRTVGTPSGLSQGVGIGTNFSIWLPVPYTITTINTGEAEGGSFFTISEFQGDFSDVAPLTVGLIIEQKIGSVVSQLRVKSVNGVNPNQQVRFEVDNGEGVFQDYTVTPGTRNLKFRRIGRQYQITEISETQISVKAIIYTGATPIDDPSWPNFPTVATSVAGAEFFVEGGNVYGKWSGPFGSVPIGEISRETDLDFFFPSGLGRIGDGGNVETVSIRVEIQYRTVGQTAWTSVGKVYTAATLDQIGFTERFSFGEDLRREFRVRRTTATSTDTRINDKVQWYAMRSLLQSPVVYADWTTMAVRIKGLGDIGMNSENRINLIATRMLPVLQPDGSWSAPQATREISAAFRHIVHSVGYSDAQIDVAELQRLQAIWTARGETVDTIFDQTTVRSALEVCVNAGMSDLTLSDGLLTPFREGVRTQFDGPPFSMQNVVGDITRSFTLRRPDDNDGVQIEFEDEGDDFVTKTVDCMLPGSIGAKLQKVKLPGVTDRTRAWRIGMRRARELVYRRWTYGMTTEFDALVARRGDYIPVVPDIPEFGQSAIIRSAEGVVVESTEVLRWQEGQNHVVAWRLPNGSLGGPFPATRVNERLLQVPAGTPLPVVSLSIEPPHLFFGTMADWCLPALVTAVRPQNENRVELQAVNYDARVYDDDNNTPG